MISKKMEEAINAQINAELYSSYLYLSMNAWCTSKSLDGFAHWMMRQTQEEISHAMILYKYLEDRGGVIHLDAIAKPEITWDTPLALAEKLYEHEQLVTSLINNLMTIAISENDYATKAYLQWFVSEQVEEEATASQLVAQLKLIGEDTSSLFMLDKDLSARVFNLPAQLQGVI